MNSVAMLSRKIVRFRRFYGLPFGSLRKLGLSLFAFTAFALVSEAQSSLTNNLNTSPLFAVDSTIGSDRLRLAQGFTTGAHTLGYNLTSLILKGSRGFSASSGNTVTLHKGSRTGTKVADFTDVVNNDTTITYTPTTKVVLEPNTEYVFITGNDFSGHFLTTKSTASTNSAGWSIANSAGLFYRGSWSTLSQSQF